MTEHTGKMMSHRRGLSLRRARLGSLLAGACIMLLAAGCEKQPPTAMVYVLDPTESCRDGRERFRSDFEKIVVGGYLGQGRVAIIRSDAVPRLLYGGPAVRGKELREALAQAEKPAPPNSGSNPAEALAIAREWLNKPEFKGWRRICVMYSDLINDPCLTGAAPKHFADPLKFRWAPVEAEVHLYGVPYLKHNAVRAAWKGLKFTPRLHQANETLDPQDLGLQAKAL